MPIDFELLRKALEDGHQEPVPTEVELAESGCAPSPGEPEDFDAHGNKVDSVVLPPIEDSFDFVSMEILMPPEIIKGLAHQGTKMILGGGSKSYKTWLQLDLAVSLAYGLDWLGFECIAGRVLYVNLEIPRPFFQRRVNKMYEARGVQKLKERLDIWNLRGYAADYRQLLPMITARIKATGYIAVFIDPVYKIYGKTDENSASEVAQLLNGTEKVCVDTGAMVAFGAHYSKGNQSNKEAIDRVSGSGTFARDPDSIINFTQHEDKGAFVVEPILRNLAPVEPFVVRWKYPLMVRDDDADPSKLKQQNAGRKKEHDPLDFLRLIQDRTQGNPISVSEWANLAGIARPTLIGYLGVMRDSGWILTIGEGQSARKAISEKGLSAIGVGN